MIWKKHFGFVHYKKYGLWKRTFIVLSSHCCTLKGSLNFDFKVNIEKQIDCGYLALIVNKYFDLSDYLEKICCFVYAEASHIVSNFRSIFLQFTNGTPILD